MGKEYELPWTCKQGDYITLVLGWFVLFTAPLTLVLSLIYNPNPHDPNNIHPWFIAGMVYGLIGTVVSWMFKLISLDYPSFRCKIQKNGTDSQ